MRKSASALRRLEQDEDIAAEAENLSGVMAGLSVGSVRGAPSAPHTQTRPMVDTPLNYQAGQGGHMPSDETRRMLQDAGGQEALTKFTTLFYQRAFADPVIDLFIREHSDPHGHRFASWIAEKFGVGRPWTEERATRKVCPFHAHGHTLETPHDRSSAHFAAWHSPKRCSPCSVPLHLQLAHV